MPLRAASDRESPPTSHPEQALHENLDAAPRDPRCANGCRGCARKYPAFYPRLSKSMTLGLQRRPHGEHSHLFIARHDLTGSNLEVVGVHDFERRRWRIVQCPIARRPRSPSADRQCTHHLLELRTR